MVSFGEELDVILFGRISSSTELLSIIRVIPSMHTQVYPTILNTTLSTRPHTTSGLCRRWFKLKIMVESSESRLVYCMCYVLLLTAEDEEPRICLMTGAGSTGQRCR